jgi:hypothetical protein
MYHIIIPSSQINDGMFDHNNNSDPKNTSVISRGELLRAGSIGGSQHARDRDMAKVFCFRNSSLPTFCIHILMFVAMVYWYIGIDTITYAITGSIQALG